MKLMALAIVSYKIGTEVVNTVNSVQAERSTQPFV